MQALNLPDTLALSVDVTDRAALAAAVREGEARFGPADALINNAGVMLLGDITRQDPDQWDRMLDVNVKGVLNGVHAVAAGMVQRKRGNIINISSVAGRKTFPNHVAYVGTKFAVHGLSENLREELSAHNVRVTTIAPGAVETELLGHTTDATSRRAMKRGRPRWAARCWPPRTWPTPSTTPTRSRTAYACAKSFWLPRGSRRSTRDAASSRVDQLTVTPASRTTLPHKAISLTI